MGVSCLLGVVYVPCIYHMPGGVIIGDSGLSGKSCNDECLSVSLADCG